MLTRLQEALQRSVAGLPLADRMKADIAAIHLADRDGDSEDVVLFGLEVLRFSPVIAIHRIASTYDVLPASVPLGRGVFVDGIRALDVTGDGIKEAVVTHGDDGSAGTVHVDVLRWWAGPSPSDASSRWRSRIGEGLRAHIGSSPPPTGRTSRP